MTCLSKQHSARSAVKRFLPPSAAEYAFETDVFFMILLRKIMKNTSVSNLNLAQSAVKKLFTQHQKRIWVRPIARHILPAWWDTEPKVSISA
jgi:hypothetical protein